MTRALAVVVLCGVGLGALGCQHHDGCEPNYAGPYPDDPAPSGGDGSSCDGTYTCPLGQIAVLEGPVGAEACICRLPCNPDAALDGGTGTCPADRVCIQLEDENGGALAGQGSCEPEYQGVLGDPCGPQQCQPGIICAGYTADTAYCREQCEADGTCPVGFACTSVSEYGAPVIAVCLPVVGDVAEGGACSLTDACQQDLFCAGGAAGTFCRPACDPWSPLCASGARCARVEDPEARTLGYACVP
ncbi:MAG TPA: hypothetical protein VGK17_04505 [Propionicimonas sp.]|jgi:hypothetical protein